jgi:hypothetical protein
MARHGKPIVLLWHLQGSVSLYGQVRQEMFSNISLQSW